MVWLLQQPELGSCVGLTGLPLFHDPPVSPGVESAHLGVGGHLLDVWRSLPFWKPSRGRGRRGSGTGSVGVASLSWARMVGMAEEAGLQGTDQTWGKILRAQPWAQ